ncbi:MAG: cation:proton antiporter, partial [Chloroflexi bacterium]|nr:cation:proton antiporter [Chloroflexota bacterium]
MTPFLQLILAIAIIIVASKGSGRISSAFGQPAVLGELLAGVVLGPSLINFLHWPIFPDEHLQETISLLAEMGVVFLMLVAGMEVNPREMLKSGRTAAAAGSLGVIAPLIGGMLLAIPFGYAPDQAIYVGIILATTSVSISAQTLLEMGQLRTKIGMTLLGAAVFDDILGILVLSVFLALTHQDGDSILNLALVFIKMIIYLGGAAFVGFRILPWLVTQVQRLHISEGVTALAIVTVLLFAWSAEVV